MSASQPPSWIIETDDGHFERDVIDQSYSLPVVVDFWAEWCGPCRLLGPMLESLAEEYAGRFALVKADTEKTPQFAGRFQVSAIPAVFALIDGTPVDTFSGVLEESQLRAWLEGVLRQATLRRAEGLEQNDPEAAEALYGELHQADPQDAGIAIRRARVLLELHRDEECRALLEQLAARGYLEPEAEKLQAQLKFRGLAAEDIEAARRAAAENPADLNGQLKLAELLAAQESYAEAFDLMLDIVARDRHGAGEVAREKMVEMFRLLPDDSELLRDYRRKLSMALY